MRRRSENVPDAYKVSVEGAPDQYFGTDPRSALPATGRECDQRRMSWHGPVVVYDLCYRDGRLWDGYDINQIRGYDSFNEFREDPKVLPENYYYSQY